MGTWGAGNFDSDAALDIRDEVAGIVEGEIRGFMSSGSACVEDLDQVLACVAIKVSLIEQCSLAPSNRAEALALREKVVKLFDADFEKLEPAEGHMEERRKVITETLDRLVAQSTADEGG